jgi:hypothetical protein
MRIKFLDTVLESLTRGSYPEYTRILSISLYIAVEKVPPSLFVCFLLFFFLLTLYSRSIPGAYDVQLEREKDIRRLLSRCTDT